MLIVLLSSAPAAWTQTYTTNFPGTENPISEGGKWINGKTVGLDWGDISTTPGLAVGQSGAARYADATALLTGTWGPDQSAEATVQAGSVYGAPEVELRLRSSLSAHVCTGYEISNSVTGGGNGSYLIIVRWNGPLADFTYLANLSGPQYSVTTGDVVKATIVGNVITSYKNGVQMAQVTDNTYSVGNPGMGFNEGVNGSYGYTSYTATVLGAVIPTITTQPSSQTVTAGQTATFSVAATGTPSPSYQWRRKDPGGATWNNVGTNASTYTTPGTTAADNGATYQVVVSNSAGSVTSTSVSLTVTAVTVTPAVTTQPSPQTVTVGQSATFTVTASGTAPLSYQWQRQSSGSATWTNVGINSASYTTPGTTLSDGGAAFRVVVSNTAGSATSNAATLTVNSPVGGALPSPWLDQDIGAVGVAGSASDSGGTFTILGAGADIWGAADAFHFAYQSLTGDGSIVAHVTGLGATNTWAKAGVMIRETLNANSTFADAIVTSANGTAFQRRTSTGGTATTTAGPAATVPYWVRIERVGNTFTGSVSTNGTTWTAIGTETIPMAATVFIGLAVTSHDATVTTTAMVDSISGTGGWPSAGGGTSLAAAAGGGGSPHNCGSFGLDLLLPLGLFWLRRRRTL
jgi:hypothetical protein